MDDDVKDELLRLRADAARRTFFFHDVEGQAYNRGYLDALDEALEMIEYAE